MFMKKHLLLSFLMLPLLVNAQSGCTDPQASNYDPQATVNDGSCVYPPSTQSIVFIAKIPAVVESSGLVLSDGFLFSHNDSGNPRQVYKLDTSTGALLQTLYITNYPNIDWEDITADSNYLYLGDFGNNDGDRTDLRVLRISKSQFANNTGSTVYVTAEAINFSYTDQTVFSSNGNNYDCEAFFSKGDSLYLFTKDHGDMKTRVYSLPKDTGTYSIAPYTSWDVSGMITGADYNKDTKEVVLIGYESGHIKSFLYYLNDFTDNLFFSGNKRRIEIGNTTNDWQTEGVAYSASPTKLFISCETSYVPASLYSTDKSSIVSSSRELQNTVADNLLVYPNPVTDVLNIEYSETIDKIEIYTTLGERVLLKKIGSKNCTIKKADLKQVDGMALLKVFAKGKVLTANVAILK